MMWMIVHVKKHALDAIESLNCGDCDFEIEIVLTDLVQVKELFDELKMVVILLCESDGGDTTCSLLGSIRSI